MWRPRAWTSAWSPPQWEKWERWAARRRRAVELFARLADEPFVPALRQLLGDQREEQRARMAARRALVRLKAELPIEELEALLRDQTLWEHPVHCYDIADLLE